MSDAPPIPEGFQPVSAPAQDLAPIPEGFKVLHPDALDYNAPDEEVRRAIRLMPETEKHAALDKWADTKVAKIRAAGFDRHPDPATGIPLIGGALDEATAGIQAGLNAVTGGKVGAPYDEALAFERASQRAADAAHPAEAVLAPLAGGLATAGPVLKTVAAGARALPLVGDALGGIIDWAATPRPTAAGRIVQGTGIGGALGAEEGFTRGEGNFQNRVESAESGAKVGAATGGVLSSAVELGSKAAELGGKSKTLGATFDRLRYNAPDAADRELARRIERSGKTPAQIQADLDAGQEAARLDTNSRATLPEMIGDTTDDNRRALGIIYRQGGEGAEQVKTGLDRRQRGPDNLYESRPADAPPDGQYERISDTAGRALLLKTAGSARKTDAGIVQQMKAEGDRLYPQARAQSESFDLSPVLDAHSLNAMQYPKPFANKYRRAIQLFTSTDANGKPTNFPVDNVTRFDNSKKALDDMIEAAGKGGENNLQRELVGLKNDLLAKVHENDKNPIYQKAREAWGSHAERREAIEFGKSILNEGSEAGVEGFRALNPGQQKLARIGFLSDIRNRMSTAKPGDDVTKLFQQRRVQELLKEMIPESQTKGAPFANRPARFGELMRREGRMTQTRNEALGNSKTAQRGQDDAEFAGNQLSEMWKNYRGIPSLANMGFEAVGKVISHVFRYRDDVALELAKRLMTTNPAEQRLILGRLQNAAATPPGRSIAVQNFTRHPMGGRYPVKQTPTMRQFSDLLDEANRNITATIARPLDNGHDIARRNAEGR